MTVTEEYVGDQFLLAIGEAACGATAIATMTDDTGLAVWGDSVCGATAIAEIEDIALLMYGEAACGATAIAEIEEDIIFIDAPMYGEAVCGVTGTMRLFLDPYVPGLSRFLPEGQSS